MSEPRRDWNEMQSAWHPGGITRTWVEDQLEQLWWVGCRPGYAVALVEGKENAHLIQAAPDLLEACEAWVACQDHYDTCRECGKARLEGSRKICAELLRLNSEVYKKSVAAIQKARGNKDA